jgi:hypothetical protein
VTSEKDKRLKLTLGPVFRAVPIVIVVLFFLNMAGLVTIDQVVMWFFATLGLALLFASGYLSLIYDQGRTRSLGVPMSLIAVAISTLAVQAAVREPSTDLVGRRIRLCFAMMVAYTVLVGLWGWLYRSAQLHDADDVGDGSPDDE